MSDKLHVLTETQMRTFEKLSTAAQLLDAGLPPSYTTTPMGRLRDLHTNAATILIYQDRYEITDRSCDWCGAFPCATTHHPDKDVSLCGKCWKEAES